MHKRDYDLIERCRAARGLLDSRILPPDMEIEAFMGIFHPERQADRRYMAELKADIKRKEATQ